MIEIKNVLQVYPGLSTTELVMGGQSTTGVHIHNSHFHWMALDKATGKLMLSVTETFPKDLLARFIPVVPMAPPAHMKKLRPRNTQAPVMTRDGVPVTDLPEGITMSKKRARK